MRINAAHVWAALSAHRLQNSVDNRDASSSSVTLEDRKVSYSSSGNSVCTEGILTVPVMATNKEILLDEPADDLQLNQMLAQLVYRNGNNTLMSSVTGRTLTIQKDFKVWTKLCLPGRKTQIGQVDTVHLLTHGGTLDHTYWDIGPGNSYVDAATAAGYATLAYDRVGTGQSEHPDPIRELQTPVHVEVAHALAEVLKTSGLENHRFDKVVGVGHSIGAWFTHAAANEYPQDFDAVVLTGVSLYLGFLNLSLASNVFQIANTDASGRFRDLPNGYLVPGPLRSVQQYNFYYYPNFDMEVLQSQYDRRQTLSLGELLTLPDAIQRSQFSGPSFVATGNRDLLTCGGDCSFDSNLIAQVQPGLLPLTATGSRYVVIPETGHNINGHRSANDVFAQIFQFLDDVMIPGASEYSAILTDL